MLELLLKPGKWLDEKIQRQYTRIGQHIPENYLYTVTGVCNVAGSSGLMTYFTSYLRMMFTGTLFSTYLVAGSDFSLNLQGLLGKLKKEADGRLAAINPFQNFDIQYNKLIRPYVFISGVSFSLSAAYTIMSSLINGEPMQRGVHQDLQTALSFFALASSMYLKDQDTRLLDRKKVGTLQPAVEIQGA